MDTPVDFTPFFQLNKQPRKINAPYDGNISAGKNTYVYDAHTYHTKVPPEGIETFIEYYTNIGDVVLDPFCGSGMTGIAAQRRHRKAILSDLSPAAIFIAENLNSPIDADIYMAAIYSLLEKSKQLDELLYATTCRECGKNVNILYTIWSYGCICPVCNQEFIIWDVARDEKETVKKSKILNKRFSLYDNYIIHYEHVDREDEFNFRKLCVKPAEPENRAKAFGYMKKTRISSGIL